MNRVDRPSLIRNVTVRIGVPVQLDDLAFTHESLLTLIQIGRHCGNVLKQRAKNLIVLSFLSFGLKRFRRPISQLKVF